MPTLQDKNSDADELNPATKLQKDEVDFVKRYQKRGDSSDTKSDDAEDSQESNEDPTPASDIDTSKKDDDSAEPWNYNSDSADKSRADTNDAEKNPDASMFTGGKQGANNNQKSSFAGKSAAIALAGGGLSIIVLVGMLGNFFSSILNNMAELFKNENTSTRTNMVYRNAAAAHQFTKGKCDGKFQVFCRFQNVSDRRTKSLERAGFRIIYQGGDREQSRDALGRYKVDGYIAPDGTEIRNGAELQRWSNASSNNARLMNLATKGKVAFWWNQKFYEVQKRWGIDKFKKLIGRNRQELDDSLNRNTNGNEGGESEEETRRTSRERASEDGNSELKKSVDDINKRIGKAGWIAAAVTGACGIYNVSHKLTAYAKNYQIQQMIKYANVFLNTADRIKDLGDVEPEVISYAGKIMTDPDPREKITVEDENGDDQEIDNPDYGKTFMDSQGYKTITHGDTQKLSASSAKFRPGGSTAAGTSWLSTIDSYTKAIEVSASAANPSGAVDYASMAYNLAKGILFGDEKEALQKLRGDALGNVKEGRQTIRYACTAGEDAALIGYIVMCGISVGELFTGVLTAAGAAQLGGCALAAACQVGQYLPGKPCQSAAKAAMDMVLDVSKDIGLTDKLLSYLQESVLGTFTKYKDAGEAAAVGNAYLTESTSMSYGLRPAKNAGEVQKFVASTNADMAMDDQIAYEDARSTPFDISNRYSFLGTALRKANLYIDGQAPLYSSILSAVGMIPRTLAYSDTTYATYSQPIQDATKRYDCNDPDLLAIGITQADKFCSTTGVTPEAELAAARTQANDEGSNGGDMIEQNLTYMTTSQPNNEDGGGTLDDSFCGVPVLDTALNLNGAPTGALGALTLLLDAMGSDEENKDDGKPCQVVNREASIQPSVDQNGKTIPGSQYDMYEQYCTEKRKDPWGTFSTSIQDAKSNRDIDWWTGEQCLKDTPMMANFRTYYNMCTQIATMDGTKGCWTDDAQDGGVQAAGNVTNSECSSGGDTKAIYTCALKYDNYGYKWGGGHSDVPNAQKWINDFKSGAIPEWTPILDCSGLVRMAYVEAMGVEDAAYTAPGGFDNNPHWQKLGRLEDAQQGDIVTSSGHVAIIESNDPGAKTFKIFDAETENSAKEDNIRHSTQSYGSSIAAYRAKKVTAT